MNLKGKTSSSPSLCRSISLSCMSPPRIPYEAYHKVIMWVHFFKMIWFTCDISGNVAALDLHKLCYVCVCWQDFPYRIIIEFKWCCQRSLDTFKDAAHLFCRQPRLWFGQALVFVWMHIASEHLTSASVLLHFWSCRRPWGTHRPGYRVWKIWSWLDEGYLTKLENA